MGLLDKNDKELLEYLERLKQREAFAKVFKRQ